MNAAPRPLLLIGAGKMGGAMLTGWLDRNMAADGVIIVEPNRETRTDWQGRAGVSVYHSADEIADTVIPGTVILAVKPQMMDDALAPLQRFVGPETAFLSIAAGKTIAYFEQHLAADAAIIRAMPNTPSAVGRGITAYCTNAAVSAAQASAGAALLAAVGEVVAVDSEALIDAVTAVSGSGPAYVFYLIETLADAGAAAGLPAELAMQLAHATVCGSGELARLSDQPARQLRINVTSPGGTTQAALEVLMDPDTGLQPLMRRAVAAAEQRARELAG